MQECYSSPDAEEKIISKRSYGSHTSRLRHAQMNTVFQALTAILLKQGAWCT